jgi:chemotaxis signal transduction protein/HPt (histidine-containing phosphotransfer) domain-containing protein
MGEFSDLIPEFVEESLEHLKNIEEDIIIIERGTADNELINRVFRAVHSIKGGSSFLGLKNIEQLSHKMEDIFNLVRNNDLEFTSQISSSVLKSVDKLREMLESTEDSDNFDISSNLSALEACLGEKHAIDKTLKVQLEETNDSIGLDKYTFDSLKKQGKKVYHIQFELKEKENQNYSTPLEFFREIEKTGEIVQRNVDIELVLKDDSFTGEGIPLSIIYASVLEKDLVAYIFGIEEDRVIELKDMSGIETKKTAAPEMEVAEESENEKEIDGIPGGTDIIEEVEEEDIDEDVDEIKDKNEYLTFLVGDEEYGIGITQVHEIITMQEITKLPGAEPFTKGIINLRGDIIPIYDFRMKLQFDERNYDAQTVILIVMIQEKKTGIVVDRVSEVIQLAREQITEAPQMQQIPSEYVIGIGQKDGKFVVLLKVSAIFNIDAVAA